MPTRLRCASGCPPLRDRLRDTQKLRRQLQSAAERNAPFPPPGDKTPEIRSAQNGRWFRNAASPSAIPMLRDRRKPCDRPSKLSRRVAGLAVISRSHRPEWFRTTSNPGPESTHPFLHIAPPERLLLSVRRGLRDTNRDTPECRAECRPRHEGC